MGEQVGAPRKRGNMYNQQVDWLRFWVWAGIGLFVVGEVVFVGLLIAAMFGR